MPEWWSLRRDTGRAGTAGGPRRCSSTGRYCCRRGGSPFSSRLWYRSSTRTAVQILLGHCGPRRGSCRPKVPPSVTPIPRTGKRNWTTGSTGDHLATAPRLEQRLLPPAQWTTRTVPKTASPGSPSFAVAFCWAHALLLSDPIRFFRLSHQNASNLEARNGSLVHSFEVTEFIKKTLDGRRVDHGGR